MCHMFFVHVFSSRFVTHFRSVVFVVLVFYSLSVSLFLLFLSEVFAINNCARFCMWFGIFACVFIRQLDVLMLCMSD